ncbi:43213_t:CDS:10, partial [Gigaspora margarita]
MSLIPPGNSQEGCLVREINPELEVLMLHENLQAILLDKNALPSTAGYYNKPKTRKENWIPLLPGYSIFFQLAKKFYKFSIINENHYLKFQSITYDDDDLTKISGINSDYGLFRDIWTRIDPTGKRSLLQYLGFLDEENVAFLKATVAMHYLNLLLENQLLVRAKKNEILLLEKLKVNAGKISILIDTKSKKENPSILIQHDIFLEKGDKNLPPECIQALMLEHKEEKVKVKNLTQKINRLKKRIEQLDSELEQSLVEDDLDKDNSLESNINNAIESNQLGSMILVSTKNYLSLVLTQPCPNCSNSSLSNKIYNISSIGFQVKCIIECKKCNDIYEYTNEKETRFAKATAAAGLAGGISHNALQSSLATIGITSQIGRKLYNNYQKMYFTSLIASAKLSTTQALQRCIEYAVSQKNEALAVGFDCSWAHVRNANQASSEFICQEMLSEYFHKPIIAFYVVQKKVLNQISPQLEENNLHLEICVDGDLDSNKTLVHVHIRTKISADLKHLTKNIRNSVLKDKNFKPFEDHIMRWFHDCIYSAELKREAKDQFAPSEEETRKMQVDGLIRHLQNNHSSCWSDICWTKDDPTIILQNPTLCHSSEKLIGFDFSKELVYYKDKVRERIRDSEFYPSFAALIVDFDVTVRCQSCCAFPKRLMDLSMDIDKIISLDDQVKTIAEKIFKFTDLRPEQMDAINHYIGGKKNTLVIMKTGSGKSFCYAVSSIIFDGLTIIISPLKSFNSKSRSFIKLGILCGGLLASSQGTVEYEAKVCEEIALGFTLLLFVTPEKLLLNRSLKTLYKRLYDNKKLQFYPNSRIMALTATLSWKNIKNLQNNLNINNKEFKLVRGGDLLRHELCFSVLDRKDINSGWIGQIMDLVKDIKESSHAIIYCAQVKDCTEIHKALSLEMEKGTLGIYHGQLAEDEKKDVIKKWNKKQIYIMIATSAFGLANEDNKDNEQTNARMLYLIKAQFQLFEQISRCYQWPEDPIPPACNLCDNCQNCKDNCVEQQDVKLDILDLLNVASLLCENNDKIVPLDVVNVFCGAKKNAQFKSKKLNLLNLENREKPKWLKTKELAKFALADLVRRGLLKQTIWLDRKANTAHITCNLVIEGMTKD